METSQVFKEGQEEGHPQPTLYDLYMGYFGEKYSPRALKEKAWHLHAVLIQETPDRLFPLNESLVYEGKTHGASAHYDWMVYQNREYSFALMEKMGVGGSFLETLFHPLKLLWGDPEHGHSFVTSSAAPPLVSRLDSTLTEELTPESQSEKVHWIYHPPKDHEQDVELIFTLSEEVPTDDKEKMREIAFYFNAVPEAKILVEENLATTFQLQEKLTIAYDHLTISVEFLLEEGEGQFFGHLMRGNRPTQLSLKGSHRFKSYDWQIFLRTIRRSPSCKIRARIRLKKNE